MYTNLDAGALPNNTADDGAVDAEAVEPEVAAVKLVAGRGRGAGGAEAAVEADAKVAEAREEVLLPEVAAAAALVAALLHAALRDLVPDLASDKKRSERPGHADLPAAGARRGTWHVEHCAQQ